LFSIVRKIIFYKKEKGNKMNQVTFLAVGAMLLFAQVVQYPLSSAVVSATPQSFE
jgi:hypothetical protein